MKRTIKHTLYIISFLLSSGLFAQNLPKISMTVDTTAMRIGEQIKLRLLTETDTLSFVDFPEPSNLGDFEVVETSKVDTLTAKPVRRLKKDYYITQWDSGKYVVPPINIKINDSIFKTDSLNIAVKSVAVDTTKQALYGFKEVIDIKGQDANHLKPNGFNWWWLIVLLLLVPLFLYLRKKRQEYIEKNKPLPPYEKAIQALSKLKKDDNLLQSNIDKYYLQLTDILKAYLEEELHFSAKEKISSQLLQDLKAYRFENGKYFDIDILQRLQQTFNRADLAKFAQMQPPVEDVQFDFTVIHDIITQAHTIIQAMADEKADELAKQLASKKRKKKMAYIISASIIALVLIIGGGTYYYLKKSGYWDTVKENIAAPEWVYSEYGGNPAVGLTTPHILNSYDILDMIKDEKLKKQLAAFDEISFYADNNIVKGYAILELNLDFKQEVKEPAKIAPLMISGMLQQIKATDVKVEQEELENGIKYFGHFTAEFAPFHKKKVYEFESIIFPNKTSMRMVIGVHYQGNKDNKNLIERVISSIELVK